MSEQTTLTADSGSGMKILNRNALKYIVIVAMVIDHIAWGFPEQLGPGLCHIMHFVGRLTGPTMAFFLAEGYKYTSNKKKYQLRLGIFALISWLPFLFFERTPDIVGFLQNCYNEPFIIFPGLLNITLCKPLALFLRIVRIQGVIYTLFLGITALLVWDSEKLQKWQKVCIIVLLTFASLMGDWPIMDVLGPLFLYTFRNDKKSRYISVGIVYGLINMLLFLSPAPNGVGVFFDILGNWETFGILLVPVIIWLFYNGKGGKKSAFNKWFFYIFYPAHLVMLGILKMLILK